MSSLFLKARMNLSDATKFVPKVLLNKYIFAALNINAFLWFMWKKKNLQIYEFILMVAKTHTIWFVPALEILNDFWRIAAETS